MKRWMYIFLIMIFTCTGLYSAWNIYKIQREYAQGESVYAQLDAYVSTQEQTTKELETGSTQIADSIEETIEESTETTEASSSLPLIDFAGLKEINSDFIGWIYIPDTKVNYPIVQAKDNDYYLYRLFDRTINSAGSIFMDMRNHADFSDGHTIIYGHHMRNGSMFAGLKNYKDSTFYATHTTGYILTEWGNYEIIFFAGHVANVSENAWDMGWNSDEDREIWIREQIEKSAFSSFDIPLASDTIITLSTCSYEFDDARFVLSGILRKME